MNPAVYAARRELMRTLNVPVTRGGMEFLRWRQRLRLGLWELNLSALYGLKRALDVFLSLSAMLALSPVYIAVGFAIWIEDGWPVFYAADRVGLNGRVFRFFKFRSMRRNADKLKSLLIQQNESKDGVIFKMKNDPRITRAGRFIRRYSIDELPQFYNVLIGDMALVGPRPPVPREVVQYTLDDRKRLHVKPGITCLWQIQGRSEIPFKEQVRLDLQYIHSQGVWRDLVILIKTVPAVLLGKGAY
ncbi:MAG: sugar transferase [bacterium]